MNVSYRAPAKVILSGEHSVVYTKPAFVTAVNMHLTVSIRDSDTEPSNRDLGIAYCEKVVQTYLKQKNTESHIRPYTYQISTEIPRGRGMGSSAALCVAMTAALYHFYTGMAPEKNTINSLAYQAEKHFHGMPSGVDVSASCQGGLIYYRKEFEFLKTVSALNFKLPKDFEENLYLIDTGKPLESTKEMVAHVGKRYNADPRGMDQTLSAIEKITKRMVVSVVKEDRSMFAESIADNQKHLVDLGIVSPSTQELLKTLAPYGVGKVTGAGGLQEGSGLILFFADETSVENYLKDHHIKWYPFIQNHAGVEFIS